MGMAKLMNVDTRLANSEDDALNILFEGDSNRVMCATSQNPNSSRSHVVFIMEITSTVPGSSEAQVSKLNIVDLAGSERAFKKDGVNPLQQLNEARAINSSLFFLEQCINALAQKQSYIPYRNTFITNLLKDSIGGNCKTVMIATINPDPEQLAESISTCKFAQRVATIKQVAKKNIVVDPYVKIKYLKKKIKTLKERLAFYENGNEDANLDENEKAVVFDRVKEFIDTHDLDIMDLGGKFSRVQEAFRIMRSIIKKENISIKTQNKYDDEDSPKKSSKHSTDFNQVGSANEEINIEYEKQIKNLQSAISLRDIEIDILVSMITKKQQERQEASIQTVGSEGSTSQFTDTYINQNQDSSIVEVEKVKPVLTKESLLVGIQSQAQVAHDQASPKRLDYRNKRLEEITKSVGMIDRAQAFEQFRRSYRKYEVIERCKEQLKLKFEEAKQLGSRINHARVDIESLKGRLIQLRSERAAQGLIDSSENRDEDASPEEQSLIEQIKSRKDQYTSDFEKLKETKKEIQYMNKNLEKSQIKLQQDFEKWWQSTDFSSQYLTNDPENYLTSGTSNYFQLTSSIPSPRTSSTKPTSSFSPKPVSSFSPKYKNQPRTAWEEASVAQSERLSMISTSTYDTTARGPNDYERTYSEPSKKSTLEENSLPRVSNPTSNSPRGIYQSRNDIYVDQSYRNTDNETYNNGKVQQTYGHKSISSGSIVSGSSSGGYSGGNTSGTGIGASGYSENASTYPSASYSSNSYIGGSSNSYVSNSTNESQSTKPLNENHPLFQKLNSYIKMAESTSKSRVNPTDTRRSLLNRALYDES